MFSHVSVSHRYVCISAPMSLLGGRNGYPLYQVPFLDVDLPGPLLKGMGMSREVGTLRYWHLAAATTRTIGKGAVSILLECILVFRIDLM